MTDRRTFNLVIMFLGVTLLMCVGGGFFLSYNDKDIPEFIIGIGGTAVGAIAGILARGPATQESQPVHVVNEPLEVEGH